MTQGIPDDVVGAWGWTASQLAPLHGGLINATFVVRDGGEPIAVLQRLHAIFGADVNLDLDAVTTHLAARGMTTPRLVRTLDGRPCLEHGGVWRATTFVAGDSVAAVPDPSWAAAGGELVGRFHRAVADLAYDYRFTRAGVHDTAGHLARLRDYADAGGEAEATELAREVLAAAVALPELVAQPLRHVHGDLKISNLLFARGPLRGVALVDLDTLAKGTLAFELGDAMRSWCNPHGEDAGRIALDLPIFAAAIAGFRRVADSIVTEAERASVAVGLETVCVELAARFTIDVFEDRYFGWDPARFASRRAHNLVRARGQLALAHAVRAARGELREILLG
ncbi:MAG TPA: phosphotransferase [Kofleriaceae bacterium]